MLQNGLYKLQNVLDSRVLRTSVNGSLLKLYYDRHMGTNDCNR